jgi:hypothetical protein
LNQKFSNSIEFKSNPSSDLFLFFNLKSVHLQYQTAGHRAITSKEGPEPG